MHAPIVFRMELPASRDIYFPSAAMAIKEAKAYAKGYGPDTYINVYRVEIRPDLKKRALHCAMLNDSDWESACVLVERLQGTWRGIEDDAT